MVGHRLYDLVVTCRACFLVAEEMVAPSWWRGLQLRRACVGSEQRGRRLEYPATLSMVILDVAKAIVAAARADMGGVAPPNRKPSDPPGSAPAASSVPSLRTGVPSHWSGDSRPVSSSGCVGSGTPVQAAVAPPPATARGPPQLVRTVLSPPKSGGPGYVYRHRSAILRKSGPPVDLAIWLAYVVPTWVHEEGPR